MLTPALALSMGLLKEEDEEEEEEDAAAKRSEADRRTDKDELTSLICFAMAYSKLLIHLLSLSCRLASRQSERTADRSRSSAAAVCLFIHENKMRNGRKRRGLTSCCQ